MLIQKGDFARTHTTKSNTPSTLFPHSFFFLLHLSLFPYFFSIIIPSLPPSLIFLLPFSLAKIFFLHLSNQPIPVFIHFCFFFTFLFSGWK